MLCSSTSAADGLVGAGAAFNGATSSWVVISSAPSSSEGSALALASSTSSVAGATNSLRSPPVACGRATLQELTLWVVSVLQVLKADDLQSTD